MFDDREKDYLDIVWKDPESRQRFVIGRLTKHVEYEFRYVKEGIDEAIERGFNRIDAFPHFEETYRQTRLFTAFEMRIPDKRRKDMDKILAKYNLNEYDPYELLKKTQGKLPIDTIEFIRPIDYNNGEIERDFYIAGPEYYLNCSRDSDYCQLKTNIKVGDKLVLKREPTCKHDRYAVEVYNLNDDKLGYIPQYYSEAVSNAIIENRKIKCVVKDLVRENCQECIKVNVVIYAIEE